MLITPLSEDKMPQLFVLARELEPLFEGKMADNPDFSDYFKRKISQKEALIAIDRVSGALMGAIAFSRMHNRISWLGVIRRWQGRGAGSRLLLCALNQLNPTLEAWVTTFRSDNAQGLPARRLYEKFGFSDCDSNVLFDGHPRCLMRKRPETSASRGASFHFHLKTYTDWEALSGCPVCRHMPEPEGYTLIHEFTHSTLECFTEAQGALFGKCHLLIKGHYIHFHEIPQQKMCAFMREAQLAGGALQQVTGALKINYELHSNSMPHLHVHLFPRYLDDPFPGMPIDYRITHPSPYESREEYDWFIAQMRSALREVSPE